MSKKLLTPILKYPGGKLREWWIIKDNLPEYFNNYFEPFVGGGSTWLNVHANHYYINDLSTELMDLYSYIKLRDAHFIKFIKFIIKAWKMNYMSSIISHDPNVLVENHSHITKFINIASDKLSHDLKPLLPKNKVKKQVKSSVTLKVNSLKRKKQKYGKVVNIPTNDLTSIKTALYTLFRSTYNHTNNKIIKTGLYWFLREYAYSSMFRFNKHGGFNVPFGGASYNHKSLLPKLRLALSSSFQDKIQNTTLDNLDFIKTLNKYKPNSSDFVFLDPPYDTAFSTYDKNSFGKGKQIELSKYLKHNLNAKFMLIIKSSKLIDKLYPNNCKVIGGKGKLRIRAFNKRYQVSFQNRNNQRAEHLLIMNY